MLIIDRLANVDKTLIKVNILLRVRLDCHLDK